MSVSQNRINIRNSTVLVRINTFGLLRIRVATFYPEEQFQRVFFIYIPAFSALYPPARRTRILPFEDAETRPAYRCARPDVVIVPPRHVT